MTSCCPNGVFVRPLKKLIELAFSGTNFREIALVSQEKNNHNICGIRLDCSSEVFRIIDWSKIGPQKMEIMRNLCHLGLIRTDHWIIDAKHDDAERLANRGFSLVP